MNRVAHTFLVILIMTLPLVANAEPLTVERIQVLVNDDPSRGRWTGMLRRAAANEHFLADCVAKRPECDPIYLPFAQIVQQAKTIRNRMEQLQFVNDQVNNLIGPVDEGGVVDHWQSPAETLYEMSGDCEDYAILKMWALRYLGYNDDSLHIVASFEELYDGKIGFHAMLTVDGVILDNLYPRIDPNRVARDPRWEVGINSVSRFNRKLVVGAR